MQSLQNKRSHLVSFLVRELGGTDKVREFSSMLKQLDLCDLTVDSDLLKATENGGAILQTFVTWYMLGLLPKLVEIKDLMKKETT